MTEKLQIFNQTRAKKTNIKTPVGRPCCSTPAGYITQGFVNFTTAGYNSIIWKCDELLLKLILMLFNMH